MSLFLDRLFELDTASPDLAWKLVDSVYAQSTSVIVSAAAFSLLGLLGYLGTGSTWYLVGMAFPATVGLIRLWQNWRYHKWRDQHSPAVWALLHAAGAWAAAAGWGAWSLAWVFEPQKSIIVLVAATQAACVLGCVVHHAGLRVIGSGQAWLTQLPLFVALIVSGDFYFRGYAIFVLLQLYTALTLGRFLHRQTVDLLRQHEATRDLLARLEVVNQKLESANRELETMAATDALTGIANRRAFDAALEAEWLRAAREQTALGLLMIDIDWFKAYNDHYGHQAGDAALRAVAGAIRGGVRRPADLPARYGGEEFTVILPGTEASGAEQAAAQVQASIARLALEHSASPFGHVTLSIGAVSTWPQLDADSMSLMALADAALYAAKRSGRNQVHVAAAQPHLAPSAGRPLPMQTAAPPSFTPAAPPGA